MVIHCYRCASSSCLSSTSAYSSKCEEIDEESIAFAKQNIAQNNFQDTISVYKPSNDTLLLDIIQRVSDERFV